LDEKRKDKERKKKGKRKRKRIKTPLHIIDKYAMGKTFYIILKNYFFATPVSLAACATAFATESCARWS
jgi:hypothetical protein